MHVPDLPRRRRSRDQPRPEVPGYEVLTPVGFGAAGALWSARDGDGRPAVVSIRRLPAGERGTALLRRLAALRSTAHPHLPRVLDVVGVADDRCALVTEEVPGPNLATVRTATGDLTPGAAATLLAAIGSALGRLHEKGVIHGDVAPGNVVLAAGGVPVLVDLAGEVTHERGTPGFVAPERRVGAPASAQSDVWALAEVVRWAAGGHPDVERVLERALSPDARERPRARDLAALATELGRPEAVTVPAEADLAQARLRSGQASTQLATSRRPRGRHRRRTALRRTVLLVLAGALVVTAATATAARWTAGRVDPGTAESVVTRLVGARDAALSAGDAGALARLTEPGSRPAEQDAALLDAMGDAGVRPAGVRTHVEEVRLLTPGAPADGPWRVEVVTRQDGYTLAGAGEQAGTVVPEQSPRCTRMEIVGPDWRVAEVEPCD